MASGRYETNIISETELVPLLSEVLDLPALENLNATRGKNFPGVDLAFKLRPTPAYQDKERRAGGEDMEIAIRSQRTRIRHLEERLDQRREHFPTKGRVFALEPELVNWCFTLPG